MFTPKISVAIPVASTSVTITDVTGTSPADPTGYGQGTGLPIDNTVWNKKVFAQYLGQSPQELLFMPYTDNTEVSATLSKTFEDGIWVITQYFMQEVEDLGYTISEDGKTLTKTNSDAWADPLGIFQGVYALMYSPGDEQFSIDSVSKIVTLSDTEITLDTYLTGASDSSNLWRIYKVSAPVLVMNEGESALISDIGDMALTNLHNNVGCDSTTSMDLWNRMLLKYSAQINMACGNYSKAHNAAVLLSQQSSKPSCNA